MAVTTRSDGMQRAEAKAPVEAPGKQWDGYIEAALGFRNHWYPALFGKDVSEGEIKGITLLGEDLLLKRFDGRVSAVADRCLHRGFRFSAKPQCFSKNTITCWLHGFTFNMRDGALVTIPGAPDSPLIGKAKLRSYPVEEQKGIVWIFVGDMDPPPPLVDDVQPGVLDEDMYIVPSIRVVVNSNWRIAADTGFDPNHIFIHRENPLITSQRLPFPIGQRVDRKDAFKEIEVMDGPGPKGIVDRMGKASPVYEAHFECDGVKGQISSLFPPDANALEGFKSITGSMWLPCGLNVDPWPVPGMTHYEWYVPIDEQRHMYTIAWGKRIQSMDEAEGFRRQVDTLWRYIGYDGFNVTDVAANEGCEKAYGEGDFWRRERLCEYDVYTIAWRRTASKLNRGIQKRGMQ